MGVVVFLIGLIVILMVGGELIIGNMMVVSMVWFVKKVFFRELFVNWVIIILVNMVGVLFVVYFFGYYLGLISSGVYLN